MFFRLVFTLIGLLPVLSFASVHAQPVVCGQVIDTNTTLEADLLNCSTDPALTVENGVTLDLNGKTVSCQATTADGIHLDGQGARLRNEVVKGCQDGVVLIGTGNHKVEHILSKENGDDGFDINVGSDRNKLDRNGATDNDGHGVKILGSQNTVRDNTAVQNMDDGFNVRGTQHTLSKNVAQQHPNGSGLNLVGSGHTVKQNQAFDNNNYGVVNASRDSQLKKNTALNNGMLRNFFIDLLDESLDCGDNIWTNNTFGTHEVAGGIGDQMCIE